MEGLRACIQNQEENNSCLMQKYNATQRQLAQVEKCCHQKLDGLNRELDELLHRLADREDEITACKECINLKESEIMRLKIRLCSCDMNCSNSNTSDLGDGAENQSKPAQDDLRPCSKSKSSQPKSCHSNTDQVIDHTEEQSNRLKSEILQPEFYSDTGGKKNRSEEDPIQQHTKLKESGGNEGFKEDEDSSSARNSLGVSEVQERLRSNQRLQMEIEKQLQSLEEHIAD